MSARNINHEIIEELYSEALILADDARAAFDLRFQDNAADCNDLTRVALLSDTQLEHCVTLPEERQADADNLARLEPETRALIEESERLHARVARLDRERRADIAVKMPVASLQGRIAKAFATG